ncbi:DUF3054 domain-containing protein [Arthrobacter sp. I2-34]|uniref:DUF3054 domain-containing protein n=1 Tax=Arthrobacter hankyongi TaxID=2904801 RepID=A0ABS9L6B9_9MICC|nr:DUF3054 domain-containing protein [Arthrobacter hankyongi]MCG2622204.1 DUF3054 domain-containing protein [Arthrobacter hankyongi]
MKSPAVPALIADLAAVVVFAALGRETHEHGLDPAGVLLTAAPFLAGTMIGWLLSRAWRRPLAAWPSGVAIWLCTVVFGLLLRGATGGGLALAFQIVSLITLGVFLVGWRLATLLVIRLRRVRTLP